LDVKYDVGYNLLILFVLNTATEGTWENEAKDHKLIVVYDKNTELLVSAIDRVVDDAVELYDKYQSESLFDPQIDYDMWFISIIHDLEAVINGYYDGSIVESTPLCEPASIGSGQVFFGAAGSIYEPKTSGNNGLGLDRSLNPYDDDIVTYYDQLVCKINNAGSSATFSITSGGSEVSLPSSVIESATCKHGTCTLCIPPGTLPRGNKYKCTVSSGGTSYPSQEITVASNAFVFFPLANSGDVNEVRGNFDEFIRLSQFNKGNPVYSAKAIYLTEPVERYNFNPGHDIVESHKSDVISRYPANLNYDYLIGVHLNTQSGTSVGGETDWGSHTVFVGSKIETTLAHELGHAINYLCDEYGQDYWDDQNSEFSSRGGCPNPLPEKCRNVFGGFPCRGMPYDSNYNPLTNSESALKDVIPPTASYYSIMSLVQYSVTIKHYGKDMIYPIESGPPLRST
jgi:hypothetical protein